MRPGLGLLTSAESRPNLVFLRACALLVSSSLVSSRLISQAKSLPGHSSPVTTPVKGRYLQLSPDFQVPSSKNQNPTSEEGHT